MFPKVKTARMVLLVVGVSIGIAVTGNWGSSSPGREG